MPKFTLDNSFRFYSQRQKETTPNFHSESIERLLQKLSSADWLPLYAREGLIQTYLMRWNEMLVEINDVLDDSIKKQTTKQSVNMWLAKLQNLAYDVEDLLDEFQTETFRRELMRGESTSQPSTSQQLNSMAMYRVKEVTARLQNISWEIAPLGLKSRNVRRGSVPTSSLIVEAARLRGGRRDPIRGPTIFSPLVNKANLAFLKNEDCLDFLEKIGSGSCGEVYKAELPGSNGKMIAIKKIVQPPKQWKWWSISREITIASKIRHKNILPLLAHMARPDCDLLVYEFMKNGSLQDILNDVTQGRKELDWPVRYKIVLGIASGLEYLHFDYSHLIVHNDIKPANVFLDDDMTAKIADFGLAEEMPRCIACIRQHYCTMDLAGFADLLRNLGTCKSFFPTKGVRRWRNTGTYEDKEILRLAHLCTEDNEERPISTYVKHIIPAPGMFTRLRENENALSTTGPRPMEWSTVPYSAPQAPVSNGKKRTSSLESPIMLLSGHQSAIYTMKFNPAGTVVASGSHDRDIFLWYANGDCKNFMVLKGHKNAVLDLHWTTDGSQVISASLDKTLRAWDVETGKQIKKMAEHNSFVNSCCPSRRGPPLVVSGSDDGTAKLWDMRQRGAIQTFPYKYQITAVSFSDASDKIYSGGIDNDVKVWDLRKGEVTMTLRGHQNMITGMSLSPDGLYLLTNGMDCKLCIWDMRPYSPRNRCVKILEGHQHNFEKNLLKCGWSPDGSKVTAGSSDRMVYIWDTTLRRCLYKLPGHTGSVNESVFHPTEPVIGSCSSDKQIYLGEI